ncbi:hypothetical protein SynWH8101_1065 [Synechococcus sp. WH 8101]|uniref:hypothetical protein n=1 Tax=Synechococcus sp. WH 8101 TaxID=59932 RepID=UPI0010240FF1|nr:hypothetical protein [Synechococcus sp. WH 8101]QBE68653.1 hypothetical protein SynWH8101_1065 [Synechococcus sp. WH 8101]QNI44875.1 hypothetical protein SynRCC2555_01089 [Synechococcus sp. WH 8101]
MSASCSALLADPLQRNRFQIPGTLSGLTPSSLHALFRSALNLLPKVLPLLSWPQQSCTSAQQNDAVLPSSITNETDALSGLDAIHSLAAFEQGDWLAELDLLQLASALRQTASEQGFYEGRLFDLMIAIADVLETDHGWDLEQADAWLDRMGLWETEL